ncbi:hypothetical protein J2847_004123 [Azospirillum agricola]|nr:hypothetical protein [Azospirillum agricola]MBP2230814.1 hypothetical protein [Azospirillum agricola]
MESLPALRLTEPRPTFLGVPVPFRSFLLASTTPLWAATVCREG